MTPNTAKTRELATLRVGIDGSWSAVDFARLFGAIQNLYDLGIDPPAPLDLFERHPLFDEPRPSSIWVGEAWHPLGVRGVKFGSEGFTDFTGVGAVVSAIKDLLLGLIELCSSRNQRAAMAEHQRTVNQAQRIENARNYVRLIQEANHAGLSAEQVVAAEDIARMTQKVDEIQRALLPALGGNRVSGAQVLDE